MRRGMKKRLPCEEICPSNSKRKVGRSFQALPTFSSVILPMANRRRRSWPDAVNAGSSSAIPPPWASATPSASPSRTCPTTCRVRAEGASDARRAPGRRCHPTDHSQVTSNRNCEERNQRRKLAFHIACVFGQKSQLWYHLPPQDTFGKLYTCEVYFLYYIRRQSI